MKKENLSILFSLIALVGVVTVWGLWICNTIRLSVVSLDSFIGVMVALLGILVTFAIGWQIINALEIKAKLKEIEIIKMNLSKQQEDFVEFSNNIKCENLLTVVEIRLDAKGYSEAFMYALEALSYGVYCRANNLEYILDILDMCEERITKGRKVYKDYYERITMADKKIRSSEHFYAVRLSYTSIYDSFMKKIVLGDKNSYDFD